MGAGHVFSTSAWFENLPGPPGNQDHVGQLRVGVWPSGVTPISGIPSTGVLIASGALPFGYGPYDFTLPGPYSNGSYQVCAWVDGNADGAYDLGEPRYLTTAEIANSNSVSGLTLIITDDMNGNGLPDWWELHWFRNMPDPFGQSGDEDTDGDGLSNKKESDISQAGIGMDAINPASWDTDGDGMDDKWEYDHFSVELGIGINPTVSNRGEDSDGDGLTDWQEYCGVDGRPPMRSGGVIGGVAAGVKDTEVDDSLNPLDIDTDYDMLIDSFEAAWYDPGNGIDPRDGLITDFTGEIDTSKARADSDHDGMSNYREQCLLAELREGGDNQDKWVWEDRVPFPYLSYTPEGGKQRRICLMEVPLDLGVDVTRTIPDIRNRTALRNHEWTDPTDGTGYRYVDEDIPPGHDTDDDWLPDGWEVTFNLDPRDNGLSGTDWDDGPYGDPDDDGLLNIEEYLGQDGVRFATDPYINGTGDETNPNEYNNRLDSTAHWRWYPADPVHSTLTDPRVPEGISRAETESSAAPTVNRGWDGGKDSDDDGLTDAEEICPQTNGVMPTSPVHSCDPYRPKSALIVSPAGITIPDPEPAVATNGIPAGVREDLQRREWTIECQVKLLGTNLTGALFDYRTSVGPLSVVVYQLALSNNVPRMSMSASGSLVPVSVSANSLPTNRWVHLAGVWNPADNTLGLYVDGVLFMGKTVQGESWSKLMLPATNTLSLAVSPDGSFVNRLLLDEVRVWGVARTRDEISEFSKRLVPVGNGDDVWLDFNSPQFYHPSDGGSSDDDVLVNGGSLFDGEPGVPMENVCGYRDNYWIDDGDGQYNAARDVLLYRDKNLAEGMVGTLVDNAMWNDKDGNGVFSRDSLLAYYRFDDGGTTAEDSARRARNGFVGVRRPEFAFGDRGYALPTNSFLWVTNDAAPVYGTDVRGADDADGDGLPDGWETINALDSYDDGAGQESALGVKDGPFGPLGDPDGDGLVNLYEYWADTNPQETDSDGNGDLDAQEDRDNDGVVNIVEQELGSRPDIVDTDDDGLTDNEERLMGTGPANPLDPAVSRAVILAGGEGDYFEVPMDVSQRLPTWTLEAWVRPADATTGAGTIVRRAVEALPHGGQAVNFIMGLEPNGAGGLRLYAGYVRTDGTPYILRGANVPTGAAGWTHVAATYNDLSSTLSLYTNGGLVAVTNTAYGPPVTGKGGDAFVRLGEDMAGGLDEVRIWNRARTQEEIADTLKVVLSGTAASGLIHDFRFDDSQANTNIMSFNEFHQPHGYQDFVRVTDWKEQWRHALRLHGSVTETIPGAVVPPPSLRVILQPPSVLLEGAQWSVDGRDWMSSGDSVQGLTPGSHVVTYKPVNGWTRPSSESILLTDGVATTITREYLRNATVRINLMPDEVIDLGAAWRLDGGDWLVSGTVVSNLSPSTHVVEFGSVDGWVTPASMGVTLSPGEGFISTVEYQKITGSLTARILPTGASADGARWRFNGGSWHAADVVMSNLPLGTYTVEFGPATRWITPPSVSTVLDSAALVVVTGVYSQVTGISADIFPPAAIAAGARWRVGSGAWTNSGAVVEVAPGSYTVSFKPIEGWLSPGDMPVTVVTQQVTAVAGTYFVVGVLGAGAGSEPGQFDRPRGLAIDALHRLYVADTFNDRVQRYDPLARTWMAWGSYSNNGPAGTFNKPRGITVDGAGRIFVADQNNSRIQVFSNGQWSAIGRLGTALGEFNSPADVAVDSIGNLYVADKVNDRVQRLETNGAWSVVIPKGTIPGRVTAPLNLLIGPGDVLYVSDDGVSSNGQQRIQRFSSSGEFLSLMGSGLQSEGSLAQPGGLALAGTNLYVADINNSRVAVSPMTNMVWSTLMGSNVLSHPYDTVYDPRGLLYIADTEHSRILALPLVEGALTNGQGRFTSVALPGGTNGFAISWFGTRDWLYAVQYANNLMPPTPWQVLGGCSNIPGQNAITNCTDRNTAGSTSRFYRVLAY